MERLLRSTVIIPSNVHIHVSTVQNIVPDKINIFWAHQAHDQPSVQNIPWDALHTAIFVSEWQRSQYIKYLGAPEDRSIVIRNAIIPIKTLRRCDGKIKIIYTSTPFRGLDILLNAFDELNRDDVELHVYSSMKLYGTEYHANLDVQYRPLYDQAARLGHYHGSVPNKELREALTRSDIFAYPNTWEETSCLCAIEAISAGCYTITSDLGALRELRPNVLYSPTFGHLDQFKSLLNTAINNVKSGNWKDNRIAFNREYDWNTRKHEWAGILEKISTGNT